MLACPGRGIMSNLTGIRPEFTSAEIEKKELEWWQEYAGFEERFAWVQTPEMQRILRGRYVREIVKIAGAGGRILELGCGAGWLCLKLAEAGSKEVHGIDFSPAQIDISRERARSAGLEDRVHFECADGTQDSGSSTLYDCVVVHAFLHHLNRSEISRTLASVPRFLKPGGAFIVFEPVLQKGNPGDRYPLRLRAQNALSKLAKPGKASLARRMSAEEKHYRESYARRTWGVPPHGPSPKEMGFAPGELENYLSADFVIERQSACLVHSHIVVMEWLLRGLSQPKSTRFLLPWVARAASWLDQGLTRRTQSLPSIWTFNMLVCRLRQPQ